MGVGDEVTCFRMEGWMRVVTVVLPAVAYLVLAMVSLSGGGGFVWFAPLIVGGGAWQCVRAARLRIEFDHSQLTVFGYVRTRVIAREALIDADVDDLDFPLAVWRNARGRTRVTPLSALQLASSSLVPTAMYERRRVFLRALAAWREG